MRQWDVTSCVIPEWRLLSLFQTNLVSKGLIYTALTLMKDVLTALQLIHVHSN